MIVSKKDIQELIPQKPPFVMVDELIKANENNFESQFKVKQENIFLDANQLEAYAMIENIAQTTAAGLAIVIKDPEKKPEEGFLGSITNLKVSKLPIIGDLITTKVQRLMTFENMYKIKGSCYCENDLLIECELKIVAINK